MRLGSVQRMPKSKNAYLKGWGRMELIHKGRLTIMRSIISQIKTQENDDFRLIKALDKDNVWRLYVEGNININIAWLKQEHAGLHKSGIAMSPNGILPWKPIGSACDPFAKYSQTTILESDEKACISVFKDKYENLPRNEKLNIIREIVMPS